MKTKMMPLILMLSAGAITSIIMYVFQYEMKSMLAILLVVLFIFYVLGLLFKKILDSFEEQITKAKAKEGEMIEKDTLEQLNTEKESSDS